MFHLLWSGTVRNRRMMKILSQSKPFVQNPSSCSLTEDHASNTMQQQCYPPTIPAGWRKRCTAGTLSTYQVSPFSQRRSGAHDFSFLASLVHKQSNRFLPLSPPCPTHFSKQCTGFVSLLLFYTCVSSVGRVPGRLSSPPMTDLYGEVVQGIKS